MSMIGGNISHYKITAKLGEGGMGEVFLATDTSLDRQVALKFLPASLQKDPEARERLLREAKAASKLNHKNILTIHSVASAEDRDFIVMADDRVEHFFARFTISPSQFRSDLGVSPFHFVVRGFPDVVE